MSSALHTIRTWQAIHAKLLGGQSNAHVTVAALGNDAHLEVVKPTGRWYRVCGTHRACCLAVLLAHACKQTREVQ